MTEKKNVIAVPSRDEVVRILSYLHSVIYGLAVASAITSMIVPSTGLPLAPFELFWGETAISKFILFLIFLMFLIPYYHGTSFALAVHLELGINKSVEPLFHYLFLFVEAIAFYAMGASLVRFDAFLA